MDSPKPVTSYPFLYVKPCCSFATDLMNHRKGLNILYIQDAHKCNSHDKLVYEFNRSCASGQKLLLLPQYVSLEASFLLQLLLKHGRLRGAQIKFWNIWMSWNVEVDMIVNSAKVMGDAIMYIFNKCVSCEIRRRVNRIIFIPFFSSRNSSRQRQKCNFGKITLANLTMAYE